MEINYFTATNIRDQTDENLYLENIIPKHLRTEYQQEMFAMALSNLGLPCSYFLRANKIWLKVSHLPTQIQESGRC